MRDDFNLDDNTKPPISAEKAQKILKEHGTIVTLELAKSIVEFLSNLAEISLAVYVNDYVRTPSEFEPKQPIEMTSVKKKKTKNT